MRLDSGDIKVGGRRIDHIRVDRIGSTGERELWWVADAFADGTSKPEGMFGTREEAMELARDLAARWDVRVTVSESGAG